MAHNAAIKIARRRRVAVQVEDVVLERVVYDTGVKVDAARAASIIRRLSPRQCEAVFLRHFVGLTFAQIGDVTGVLTFTAASRYRLGMGRLRKLMEVCMTDLRGPRVGLPPIAPPAALKERVLDAAREAEAAKRPLVAPPSNRWSLWDVAWAAALLVLVAGHI